MSRRRPVRILAAIALALATAGCAGSSGPAAPAAGSTVVRGASAAVPACPSAPRVKPRADGLPPLTLSCLGAGPSVRLSDLRGTPMVLNVWSGWCQPCASEIPLFAALHDKAGARLRFFGLHYKWPRSAALGAARDFGVFYPSVQDADGDRTTRQLRVAAPPQTFFVTADGRIAHRQVGEITSAAELDSLVETYLGVAT